MTWTRRDLIKLAGASALAGLTRGVAQDKSGNLPELPRL